MVIRFDIVNTNFFYVSMIFTNSRRLPCQGFKVTNTRKCHGISMSIVLPVVELSGCDDASTKFNTNRYVSQLLLGIGAPCRAASVQATPVLLWSRHCPTHISRNFLSVGYRSSHDVVRKTLLLIVGI